MVERQLRRRGIDDERVLDGDGGGAARGVRPGAPSPPRLRRLGAADRRGPDDLPALDRRRDLPGAGAERRRAGAGGRHRLRLLGRGARPPRRRGDRRRAARVAGRRRRAAPSTRSASRTSRCASATAAAACRSGRPSTRSPSTPPPRRRRGRCSTSSPTAAASSSRSPPTRADMLTVFRRHGERAAQRGDRPLPLRAADRRGGLRPVLASARCAACAQQPTGTRVGAVLEHVVVAAAAADRLVPPGRRSRR